ncbi:MAG TPA: 4-alpha-glucanotransferase, partial [Steroidobacteraceae bacterium]|nr:4-alpha-glucanotransferase [Steroidobacteraceae bacterium]
APALLAQPSFQKALSVIRLFDNVMYEQVATLKLSMLRLLHASIYRETNSQRQQLFRQFVAERGESLRLHATFDVLDAHFREQNIRGWRQWPPEYRDPRSQAVREFSAAHEYEIEFFMYVQWLADEQLASARQFARERGMRIGLYGDLAVGANPDGSEVWSNQSLYIQDASIGAPPDPLALNGQDWGMSPVDPHVLRAQNFLPFTALLRANMRHVAALRIDHVMSLFRLWWVPNGFSAVEGVYVHYPLAALMSLLAAESISSQCLVIGEDLGTVPDEMRKAMADYRLFHYSVLLFEKNGAWFKSPSEYVRDAVAIATTHDLPPLKAWWQGNDLKLRDRLALYPNAETAKRLNDERHEDRHALLRALNDAGLWHWQSHEPLPEYSFALVRAIHLYLGQSQAALVLVQFEDLMGMTDPVNVPGTHTEHVNWQRKVSTAAQDLFACEPVRESLLALDKARTGRNPNN